MKKLKIIIYHFVVFILGSIGIIAYVFIVCRLRQAKRAWEV